MKIFLSLCLLSVAMVMVSGMESFIDIHSGEHFDDVIGTTDGKKQFAIDVGLLLYKTSCTPKVRVTLTKTSFIFGKNCIL